VADAPLFSHEAEAAVLGGLFVSPVEFGDAAARVAVPDFAEHAHRLIFSAMAALAQAGSPIDIVTVGEHLERAGHLPDPVEFHYLAVLARDTPSAANVLAYADLVRDYARRRSLVKLADDLARWARAEPDAAAAVTRIRAALDGMESGAASGLRPLAELMPETLMALDERANRTHGLYGVSTGLPDLDRMLDGLAPGRLYVIAGRPGHGKSVLGMQCARAAFGAGKAVAFFSLEMPAEELTHRLLAAEIPLNLSAIHGARLEESEWAQLVETGNRMAPERLWIDDTGALAIDDLLSRCRRLHRRAPLGLVVVDYIGLLDSDRRENRNLEVSEITRKLKRLAKELACPVIAVSQLNRKLEDRSDKRPINSDLRDSGGVEQDADVILMLYRDELYNPHSPDVGCAEILIRKQRGGPTGMIPVVFDGAHARILPLAGPLPSAGQPAPGPRRKGFNPGDNHD
jgi:replicative DNA helicase